MRCGNSVNGLYPAEADGRNNNQHQTRLIYVVDIGFSADYNDARRMIFMEAGTSRRAGRVPVIYMKPK
jgi:hypothetical protein